MDDVPAYRIPDAIKDPGESLKVEIDLYDLCAIVWRPNEQYGGGEYVRPSVPNGFAYLTAAGGLSGSKQPRWPTVIDATVTDGGVSWACKAAAANGINAVTGPTAASDPTGLTINSVSAFESHKILATYEGGTEGQSYDAVYTFTLNGVTRKARQRVNVQKR